MEPHIYTGTGRVCSIANPRMGKYEIFTRTGGLSPHANVDRMRFYSSAVECVGSRYVERYIKEDIEGLERYGVLAGNRCLFVPLSNRISTQVIAVSRLAADVPEGFVWKVAFCDIVGVPPLMGTASIIRRASTIDDNAGACCCCTFLTVIAMLAAWYCWGSITLLGDDHQL